MGRRVRGVRGGSEGGDESRLQRREGTMHRMFEYVSVKYMHTYIAEDLRCSKLCNGRLQRRFRLVPVPNRLDSADAFEFIGDLDKSLPAALAVAFPTALPVFSAENLGHKIPEHVCWIVLISILQVCILCMGPV